MGSYSDSSGTALILTERWNGANWAVQNSPNPKNGTGSSLSGVTCGPSAGCTAVGDYDDTSLAQVTLVERWSP